MQVGDFFEFYGREAAVEAGKVLGLALNKSGDMTGFPRRSISAYLQKLVRAGRSAVIVEQVLSQCPSGESGASSIERHVTRIVTPGTAVLLSDDANDLCGEGDTGLDAASNNFILAIVPFSHSHHGDPSATPAQTPTNAAASLAWADVSTGLVLVAESHSPEMLRSMLVRIEPAEILVPGEKDASNRGKEGHSTGDSGFRSESSSKFVRLVQSLLASSNAMHSFRPIPIHSFNGNLSGEIVSEVYPDPADRSDLTLGELAACSLLFGFIREAQNPGKGITNLRTDSIGSLLFERPIRQSDSLHLAMDPHTFHSLDILANSVTGQRHPSLFSILNAPMRTTMGSRLLAMRLRKEFLFVLCYTVCV